MTENNKLIEVFGKGQRMTKEFLNSAEGLTKRKMVWETLRNIEGPASFQRFSEAIASTDFSYLLTADMNAQLIGLYEQFPVSYKNWTRALTVNDFKTAPLPALELVDDILEERSEGEPLGLTSLGESNYTIKVLNQAKGITLNRQTIINDALGVFNSVPEYFARMAANTAEYIATSKIAIAAGADTTLFPTNNSHYNYTTNELTIAGIKAASNLLAEQTDIEGNALNLVPKGIIVPPALRDKANEIVKALTVENYNLSSEVGYKTTGGNQYGGLEISVDKMIPRIQSSNTYKNKCWYMYVDPQINRPTVAFATLRSNPNPRIFRQMPTAQEIGGGVDMFSFDLNSISYKVEWDIGASQIDYRGMVANVPAS